MRKGHHDWKREEAFYEVGVKPQAEVGTGFLRSHGDRSRRIQSIPDCWAESLTEKATRAGGCSKPPLWAALVPTSTETARELLGDPVCGDRGNRTFQVASSTIWQLIPKWRQLAMVQALRQTKRDCSMDALVFENGEGNLRSYCCGFTSGHGHRHSCL